MLSQEIQPKASQPSISSAIERCNPPPSELLHKAEKIEATIDMVCAVSLATINCTSSETPPSNKLITMESLNNASKADPEYQHLIKTIQPGFSKTRQLTPPDVQQYWEVRHRLFVYGDIVLIDQRLMIPKKLRNKILHHLHSAHQGIIAMQSSASKTIYWPGLNNHIKNMRDTCHSYSYNASCYSKEPLILTPPPTGHFKKFVGIILNQSKTAI